MNLPHNLPIDSKVQRLKRRYQGLSRVAAAVNDLYIYGVYPSNFPNLTVVLEQAKDHWPAWRLDPRLMSNSALTIRSSLRYILEEDPPIGLSSG